MSFPVPARVMLACLLIAAGTSIAQDPSRRNAPAMPSLPPPPPANSAASPDPAPPSPPATSAPAANPIAPAVSTSSALPATAPTSLPVANPAPAASSSPSVRPQKRADIQWDGTKVRIHAENSSLNQILRDLSRKANLRITGGVAEDLVYGDYGPAPLGDVLADLLNGTHSNMLFVSSTANSAPELVLTPRSGGATPPSVFAADNVQDDDAHMYRPPPADVTAPPGGATPPLTLENANGPGQQPQQAPPPADNGNSTDTQQQNGTKSPQDILNELLRLRQQQLRQQEK